jgi:hypothetical protein
MLLPRRRPPAGVWDVGGWGVGGPLHRVGPSECALARSPLRHGAIGDPAAADRACSGCGAGCGGRPGGRARFSIWRQWRSISPAGWLSPSFHLLWPSPRQGSARVGVKVARGTWTCVHRTAHAHAPRTCTQQRHTRRCSTRPGDLCSAWCPSPSSFAGPGRPGDLPQVQRWLNSTDLHDRAAGMQLRAAAASMRAAEAAGVQGNRSDASAAWSGAGDPAARGRASGAGGAASQGQAAPAAPAKPATAATGLHFQVRADACASPRSTLLQRACTYTDTVHTTPTCALAQGRPQLTRGPREGRPQHCMPRVRARPPGLAPALAAAPAQAALAERAGGVPLRLRLLHAGWVAGRSRGGALAPYCRPRFVVPRFVVARFVVRKCGCWRWWLTWRGIGVRLTLLAPWRAAPASVMRSHAVLHPAGEDAERSHLFDPELRYTHVRDQRAGRLRAGGRARAWGNGQQSVCERERVMCVC